MKQITATELMDRLIPFDDCSLDEEKNRSALEELKKLYRDLEFVALDKEYRFLFRGAIHHFSYVPFQLEILQALRKKHYTLACHEITNVLDWTHHGKLQRRARDMLRITLKECIDV